MRLKFLSALTWHSQGIFDAAEYISCVIRWKAGVGLGIHLIGSRAAHLAKGRPGNDKQ